MAMKLPGREGNGLSANSSMCTGSSPRRKGTAAPPEKVGRFRRFFRRRRGSNQRRKFLQDVLHAGDAFGTLLDQPIGADALSEVMGPGMANTSRPCSMLKSAVIRAPLRSAASTTSVPTERPAMIRFLSKTGVRRGPRRHLRADCSLFDQLRVKAAKVPRINDIHPDPNTATVFARLQSAPVGLGIDAGGHAAHHHPSPGSDLRRHFPRHPPSVMRRLAGAHHWQSRCRKGGKRPL